MLVRPSFVLSGACMNVAANARQLESFLQEAADVAEVWIQTDGLARFWWCFCWGVCVGVGGIVKCVYLCAGKSQ